MNTNSPQPTSKAVRILAILLVFSTVVLLTLGALTTSFRAGMADPVWPTEPWFLIVNGHKYSLEQERGFLLEHTHRLSGFTVGIIASLLALAAWGSGGWKRRERIIGLVVLLALLAAYGAFHGQMGKAWKQRVARQEAAAKGEELPAPEVFPVESGVATGLFAVLVVGICLLHMRSREPGKWVRAWSGILLVAVMLQGLLGGYRVYLDQLLGPLLSQIHGTFAQVVFALMCCLPILCRWPRPERTVAEQDRKGLGKWALALVAVVFIQLIWGVMIRHTAGSLAQRLHILSAFAVLGVALWLIALIMRSPGAKKALGFGSWHLVIMLGFQILLGVEAYLGKFAHVGPQSALPPASRVVTVPTASIRTLHVLIGTSILASGVVLALRIYRRPVVPNSTYTTSAEFAAVRVESQPATAPVPTITG